MMQMDKRILMAEMDKLLARFGYSAVIGAAGEIERAKSARVLEAIRNAAELSDDEILETDAIANRNR